METDTELQIRRFQVATDLLDVPIPKRHPDLTSEIKTFRPNVPPGVLLCESIKQPAGVNICINLPREVTTEEVPANQLEAGQLFGRSRPHGTA